MDNLFRLNASRYDFLDRFQKMIEAYNSGALSIVQLFADLVTFTQELSEEVVRRHLRENVSDEELAMCSHPPRGYSSTVSAPENSWAQ